MLLIYAKNEADDLTAEQKRISMKAELFDELAQSIQEGGAILRDETPASRAFAFSSPASLDVARIRAARKMSQSEFAATLGVASATVRRWEQSGRVPGGPARVLLRLAEQNPQLLRAPSEVQARRQGTKRKAYRASMPAKQRVSKTSRKTQKENGSESVVERSRGVTGVLAASPATRKR